MAEMARGRGRSSWQAEQAEREERMRLLLLPKDPNDDKNVIVEIRAGTGGDEAGAVRGRPLPHVPPLGRGARLQDGRPEPARDRHRRLQGSHLPGAGRGAYSRLKYESGVHRVQRVPVTEAQGRIHTSTATVAVLPEADEVDVASTRTTSASTSSGRPDRAGRASTRPTRPCASRTSRPAWW